MIPQVAGASEGEDEFFDALDNSGFQRTSVSPAPSLISVDDEVSSLFLEPSVVGTPSLRSKATKSASSTEEAFFSPPQSPLLPTRANETPPLTSRERLREIIRKKVVSSSKGTPDSEASVKSTVTSPSRSSKLREILLRNAAKADSVATETFSRTLENSQATAQTLREQLDFTLSEVEQSQAQARTFSARVLPSTSSASLLESEVPPTVQETSRFSSRVLQSTPQEVPLPKLTSFKSRQRALLEQRAQSDSDSSKRVVQVSFLPINPPVESKQVEEDDDGWWSAVPNI